MSGVRTYEKNTSEDTEVSEEEAVVPLHHGEGAVSLQPMENHEDEEIHLQPMHAIHLHALVGQAPGSWLGLADLWRDGSMLEQVSW